MQINPQILSKNTTLYYGKKKECLFEVACQNKYARGGKYNGEREKLLSLAMRKKTKNYSLLST